MKIRYRFLGRALGRYYWESLTGVVSCPVEAFWGRRA